MNKTQLLGSLLEELRNEGVENDDAAFSSRSHALVYVADDEKAITLNADECKLVFASAETVDRLLDALENPDDAGVTLVDIELGDEMLDILERRFSFVDET